MTARVGVRVPRALGHPASERWCLEEQRQVGAVLPNAGTRTGLENYIVWWAGRQALELE